jgi:stress-induced-phosphoprotein 1
MLFYLLLLQGYNRKGTALQFLHRFDDAYETYEEGLKIDPENALLKESINALQSEMQSQSSNMFGIFLLSVCFAFAFAFFLFLFILKLFLKKNLFSFPLANLFQGDVWSKLAANPETALFKDDPSFVQKVELIRSSPSLLSQMMTDKQIMTAAFVLMGISLPKEAQGKGEGS